jgi:hypothetical protein
MAAAGWNTKGDPFIEPTGGHVRTRETGAVLLMVTLLFGCGGSSKAPTPPKEGEKAEKRIEASATAKAPPVSANASEVAGTRSEVQPAATESPADPQKQRVVEDDAPNLSREEAISGVMIRAIDGRLHKVSVTDFPNLTLDAAEERVGNLFYTYQAIQVQGGGDANPGKWPWSVAFLNTRKAKFALCGGALVAPEWVLTAAHCGVNASDVALVGETNLRNPSTKPNAVSRTCVHPDFDRLKKTFDLALVKLGTPSAQVPLAMTSGDLVLERPPKEAFVVGWGETGNGKTQVLKEVRIPLVSTDGCTQDYKRFPNYPDVTSNNVCAGEKNKGKGACNGDSGGPLMVSDGSGWLDIGVFSWGNACSPQHDSGVYTRTSPSLTWIDEVTKGNLKCKD